MKLLIVDDSIEIVNILSYYMEFSGHKTDKALNGSEAVKLLQKEFYDVVITDAEMPIMNGKELCKFIKSNYPETYIIGITGSLSSLTEFRAAGADICFTKPFHVDEIEDAVENRSLALSSDLSAKPGFSGSYAHQGF